PSRHAASQENLPTLVLAIAFGMITMMLTFPVLLFVSETPAAIRELPEGDPAALRLAASLQRRVAELRVRVARLSAAERKLASGLLQSAEEMARAAQSLAAGPVNEPARARLLEIAAT